MTATHSPCSGQRRIMTGSPEVLPLIEIFDVIRVDPPTGRSVWTGLTGTRTALKRDGFEIDTKRRAYCPSEWLDERGYLDSELARASASLGRLTMRRTGSILRSRVP